MLKRIFFEKKNHFFFLIAGRFFWVLPFRDILSEMWLDEFRRIIFYITFVFFCWLGYPRVAMIFTNFTNSIVFYWPENFHGIQWANELYCLGGEKTKYQKIFHLIDRHISYSDY